MHPQPPSASLVLRPDRSRVWAGLVVAGVPLVLLLVGALLAGATPLAVGVLVVAGVCAVIVPVLAGSGRVEVTDQDITVKEFFRKRRVLRARAARVVRARLVPLRGPVMDTVFVLDAHGAPLVRIPAYKYRSAEIDLLVPVLGLPCDVPDRPVTGPELSSRYPHMLGFAERRPVVTALVVAGGAVAFVVLVGVIAVISIL